MTEGLKVTKQQFIYRMIDGIEDIGKVPLRQNVGDAMGMAFDDLMRAGFVLVDPRNPKLLEKLAELEHVQWMAWSQNLAKEETLSKSRMKRWSQLWKPYAELLEDEKEHDRNWARKVLKEILGLEKKEK